MVKVSVITTCTYIEFVVAFSLLPSLTVVDSRADREMHAADALWSSFSLTSLFGFQWPVFCNFDKLQNTFISIELRFNDPS